MEIEKLVLNKERNVTLEAWIQQVGGEFTPIQKRPAMLVLPGGGYCMCSDREADPVAAGFLKAGYQTFILRYSVKENADWPNPLNDYEQAMTLIRENTDKWHVDVNRVAVVGFSAGGHLAACAATMSQNRPNAALLGYAAMKKEIVDTCHEGFPYPVEKVDADTCPCFLFATRDDNVVNISNTLDFEKALVAKGITFESHIYSYGMHGFGSGEKWENNTNISKRIKNWVEDSIAWLSEIWGEFTPTGFTEPECERLVNADFAKCLSVGCTVGHLKKQSQEVQDILKDMYTVIDTAMKIKFNNSEVARNSIYGFRLCDILLLLQVPGVKLLDIDTLLKQIPNKMDE